MLLWLGAILCFFAHGISVATYEEAPNDNVRILEEEFKIKFFFFFCLVVAWCGFNSCRVCYRLLFIFSRSKKLENYGIIQKHGPTGMSLNIIEIDLINHFLF